MQKKIIHTDQAPKALGPYSQAVQYGDMLFASGSLGIDPATGKLVDGDVSAQTRQAMKNLQAILEAAQMSMANALKATIYMVDLADYPAVNEVYASFFEQDPPARVAVQVSKLPANGMVEIDLIAGK